MNLMDVYLKMVAPGAEKTAATAGTSEEEVLVASLGLTGEVKTAEDKEVVKLAASYIAMGTQIARETFVTEVLGQSSEKVAAVATEEAPATTEKAATATAADPGVEKLMADLGLIEKKAAEPAVVAEKLAADLKEGALRELISHHLVPSARAGGEKAMSALKKIASSAKGKEMITEAVKDASAAQEKSKGKLAEYLKSRNEKK
jgi:hypothetical protein